MALASRGLLAAIMVLRGECGLDPAPGLYEAQEAVMQRQHRFPPEVIDVADILALLH